MVALHESVCVLCGEFVAVDDEMCGPCASASQELKDVGSGEPLSDWDRTVFFDAARRHHVGAMLRQ